jgi:wyosine [tRNA(Phe)-imidazoG37] synthetase (radical SAM superfamily)
LGRTTNKTTRRKEWLPTGTIIDQLKSKLSTKPDYITLSGSGEPTLSSKVGELVCRIKEITEIPVAVLTNGSLLWLQEVRSSLRAADLVIPSLAAGNEKLFRYVNRPHESISFDHLMDGLVRFAEEYKGKYWLEVFLLSGITTVEAEVNRLGECISLICPDKVQINTVIRPPAEDFAMRVPADQLRVIAGQLYEAAEVIPDYRGILEQEHFSARSHDVLELLKRRPCSIDEVAAGLGLHRNEAVKYVEELTRKGTVQPDARNHRLCYKATAQD